MNARAVAMRAIALALIAFACVGAAPAAHSAQSCAALTSFSMTGHRVVIRQAQEVPASPPGTTPAVPAHCRVDGVIDERVGRDHFANGWTAPGRLDTLTYDVTAAVRRGDNRLEALLGKGWYAGRLVWEGGYGKYGTQAELLLQLEIRHRDGTVQTIVSDGSWQGTFAGPVLSSSIYDGEHYDARRAVDGWAPVVANADLGAQRLTPKPFPPVLRAVTPDVPNVAPGVDAPPEDHESNAGRSTLYVLAAVLMLLGVTGLGVFGRKKAPSSSREDDEDDENDGDERAAPRVSDARGDARAARSAAARSG